MRSMSVWLAAAHLALTPTAMAFAAEPPLPPPPVYTRSSIPLGPGERWDYVTFDPSTGRAFVAHGDHVTVVDPTGSVAFSTRIAPSLL